MSKRDQKLYLYDIRDSIEAIFSYIADMDKDDFIQDRKTYSAVIREFEIIGEATKNLSEEIIEKYNEIEWRDIVDFRNILIHEYFGVDFDIVWNVIQQDLPRLRRTIELIIQEIR